MVCYPLAKGIGRKELVMVSEIVTSVRSNADAARLALCDDDLLQHQAKTDLLGFLKSRGFLENGDMPLLRQSETRYDPALIHMCPWHTCANTKH